MLEAVVTIAYAMKLEQKIKKKEGPCSVQDIGNAGTPGVCKHPDNPWIHNVRCADETIRCARECL